MSWHERTQHVSSAEPSALVSLSTSQALYTFSTINTQRKQPTVNFTLRTSGVKCMCSPKRIQVTFITDCLLVSGSKWVWDVNVHRPQTNYRLFTNHQQFVTNLSWHVTLNTTQFGMFTHANHRFKAKKKKRSRIWLWLLQCAQPVQPGLFECFTQPCSLPTNTQPPAISQQFRVILHLTTRLDGLKVPRLWFSIPWSQQLLTLNVKKKH